MKKTIALISIILFCGCSVMIVWSPENVKIDGDENIVEIKGSDLKDNKADQKAAPSIKIPFLP